MDIWSFFRVLLRRKWLILIVTFVAVLATYMITRQLPDDYKSQATLATGITDNTNVSLDENNSSNPFVISTRFSNIIELMNSKRVISLLSYRLMIHDLESEQPFRSLEPLKEKHQESFLAEASVLFENKLDSMETIGASNKIDYTLLDMLKVMKYDEERLREDLRIERGVGSDFIHIRFISEDPHLSAFVVNALTQEFLRFYKNTKVKQVENSLEFFAHLVSQKKQELDEKTAALRQFKDQNKVINYGAQSANMLSRISQLESSREEEAKKITAFRQAIRNIESQINGDSGTDYGQKAGENNQRIVVIRNQINELNNRYVNGGMKNAVLADSLRLLRTKLDVLISQSNNESLYRPDITRQELASMRVKTQIDLEMAQARLATIEQELQQLQQQAYGFSTNEGEIASLEGDIEVARQEYLQVVDKFNTARNASLSIANRLEQVEAGKPAFEAEDSKKLLLVAISGAASFSLCIVLIFFLEFINMRVDSPAKFRSVVRLPLLGALNKVNLTGFDLKTLFAKQNHDENRETFKQLLRKIRYEIESDKPQSLLVTSNKRGEGKTFTIISLSYALSLLGKKVLIIDTNFKNNTLTKIFMPAPKANKFIEEHASIRNPHNQSNVEAKLLNEAPVKETAEAGAGTEGPEPAPAANKRSFISPTRLQGIDLMASRGGDLSPAEVFMTKNFKELIEELKKEYDYVILEGAAMNEFSDTKELVNFVDKVITIFSADSDISKLDKDTFNFLKKLDGKLVGAILNKVDSYNLNF